MSMGMSGSKCRRTSCRPSHILAEESGGKWRSWMRPIFLDIRGLALFPQWTQLEGTVFRPSEFYETLGLPPLPGWTLLVQGGDPRGARSSSHHRGTIPGPGILMTLPGTAWYRRPVHIGRSLPPMKACSPAGQPSTRFIRMLC